MVRFVQDEHAARLECAEPRPEWIRIGRIIKQMVRDQKAAMRAPRVDAKAALAAHPGDVGPVEYFKDQPEPLFKFGFPLFKHRRGGGNHNRADFLAQEEFANN